MTAATLSNGGPERSGDRIEIRGLELLVHCGVLPEEIERAQPFAVDIDLHLDLAPAGADDDLDQTINYGDLIDRLINEIQPASFSLLETMAARIADIALSYELADAVMVRVRKLRPPVAAHVATTGVRIHRTRAR